MTVRCINCHEPGKPEGDETKITHRRGCPDYARPKHQTTVTALTAGPDSSPGMTIIRMER